MRLRELDSLRGIASSIVVLTHCYIILSLSCQNSSWLIDYTPLAFLLKGGRFSVIFFFTLSGFVLALPYFSGNSPRYLGYVVRRICRIYLPYAATVLVAALLCYCFGTPRPDWANEGDALTLANWSHAPTTELIFSHLTMLGSHNKDISLDVAIWSLIVEMRVSLIFPLLIIAVKRFGWHAIIAGLVVRYIALLLIPYFDTSNINFLGATPESSLLITISQIPFFMLGIIMVMEMDGLKKLMKKIPKTGHWLIATSLLAMHSVYSSQNCLQLPNWIYGITAVYIISCCLAFRSMQDVLSLGVLTWLGKISYSLYLIHLPIMFAMIYGLHDVLPLATIVALALPVILLSAEIMNRVIERPSMQLGKRLSVHFSR